MTNPIIISIKEPDLTNLEKKNISIYKPFGVIFFSRNIKSFEQIKNLISSIKSLSKQTIILIDQEGGIVNRFKNFPEFKFRNNYDDGDKKFLEQLKTDCELVLLNNR